MAVALVGAVQNSADSQTGWANGGLEGELSYQGTGSYGGKVGSGTTLFYHTGTQRNFSVGGGNEGDHIIVVLGSLTPGKLDTKANGGLGIMCGTSGTAYGEWFVDGSDTKSPTTLFLPYIIDPARDFDAAAGGLTTTGNPAQLSAADVFGGRFDATSGIMGNFNNGLVDQITIGTGLEGTGAGGTLQEWIDADEGNTTNRWGFLTTREGVLYFQGKMYFGGTSSYTFSDSDKVVIFPDVPVASDFFEIIVDNAGSNVTFDGFTIQAPGTPKVALTYAAGTWDILNSTIDGARVVTGGAGLTVQASKLVNSGAFTQNGATVTDTQILSSTATAAFIMDDSALAQRLTIEGASIGIDATAAIVADAVTLDGHQFSANTTDVTVNSPNDIILNAVNGSNAATCTNTGAGTCTIQNAVPITLTDIVPGSRVYIENTDDTVEIANVVEPTSTFNTSINFTGNKNLVIKIRNASGVPAYKPFETTGVLTSAGFTLKIDQVLD